MKNIFEESELMKLNEHIGEVIRIHGSIYKIRRMSGFCFVILRTARYTIQCVCDRQELMERLREEACVILEARVVEEERARLGAELHLEAVEILSEPMEQMPIVMNQKTITASLENRLDFRPLTLRNEKERAIFKIQEGILRGFRSFLQREGFTEIHTPKIVYAGAEGGANIFRLNYFGREAYLAQSPQFYKQMMVGVFERVYEVGPVFRAEKHDTSRHLNEYTGVDFEMGYIQSFRNVMYAEEQMLEAALVLLEQEYRYELELLKVRVPKLPASGADNKEEGMRIPVIKFAQAKELIAAKTEQRPKESHDFEPEEEKLLSEIMLQETGSEFVFVTHYLAEKRPFYVMEDPHSPGETLSFDLLFRGLEITTGGQRIHTYEEQVAKMRSRGMQTEDFASYLMMHRHGMPPHGGLGLGLERFTARLLELDNVRSACLFPRDIHRLMP